MDSNYIEKPKDEITTSVMEDLKLRADRGLLKYATTLGGNKVDNFLQHLYEELLDAAQYIKKEIVTRQTFYELTKECITDEELGNKVREFFTKSNV